MAKQDKALADRISAHLRDGKPKRVRKAKDQVADADAGQVYGGEKPRDLPAQPLPGEPVTVEELRKIRMRTKWARERAERKAAKTGMAKDVDAILEAKEAERVALDAYNAAMAARKAK